MGRLVLAGLLALSFVFVARAQIVLPSSKTEADITFPLPAVVSAKAGLDFEVVDADNRATSPQPKMEPGDLGSDQLKLHLTGLFFWGEKRLKVRVEDPSGTSKTYFYQLQRGPKLALADITVQRGTPSAFWMYNYETQPLNFSWRIMSGDQTLCGTDVNGQAVLNCKAEGKWPQGTLGPARSDAIEFAAPDAWFHALTGGKDEPRGAQLELQFGNDAGAPLRRIPVTLHVRNHASDAFAGWAPLAGSVWVLAAHLCWITIWITLGAVLLMMAQVMVPNFRSCLRMESQIDMLRERLRALGNGVTNPLYMRCHREIESVRVGIAMSESAASKRRRKYLNWELIALSGNTAEVNRLAGILPRIESRIRLTEQLVERRATLESDPDPVPPRFYWDRETQFRNIQALLSSQFLTDADVKVVSGSLDLLANSDASKKDFAEQLELRIGAIRRQYQIAFYKTRVDALLADLGGCGELLKDPPTPVPAEGWSAQEVVFRDLCAVRLEIIYRMIALESLLAEHPDVKTAVLEKLKHGDAAVLDSACIDLQKLSEGISESDIEKAVVQERLWDAYYEPATVTDQDVLRISFVFRDKRLNRCAARNSFQCYWKITEPGANGPAVVYEQGWEAQYVPKRGTIEISPMVYDAAGKELIIRPADKSDKDYDKGVDSFDVGPPASNAVRARLYRGLIDACITAVVPVLTVAITQVQNGADLSVGKLVLLGFTSQAIRAAVVPQSVTAGADAQGSRAST